MVYIEHGRILDRGTHAELLARSAGYRALVTAYDDASARRAMAAAGTGESNGKVNVDRLEEELT